GTALGLEPVQHGRGIRVRVALGAVGPPALAGDEVLESIAIDVHAVQRVRLRQQLREELVPQERGMFAGTGPLLMPPDAVEMRRAAEDIRLAVAVHVVGEHVGARIAQVSWVELPGRLAVIPGRLLPPAAGADYVESAVAVE